ncbi:hypothetical protein [Nocardia sp. CA-135398]|uniref:hypothetical protein n=1 Tax=Nocardia sp. CA-135398 TaxID=3239977 RepID=UPI003D95D3B9
MKVASIVFAVLLAIGFLPLGAVEVLAVTAMRQRVEHFAYSVTGFRGIGMLELAGVGHYGCSESADA